MFLDSGTSMFWCVSLESVKDDSEVTREQSGRSALKTTDFLLDDYIKIGSVFSGVPRYMPSITHSVSSFSLGQ